MIKGIKSFCIKCQPNCCCCRYATDDDDGDGDDGDDCEDANILTN